MAGGAPSSGAGGASGGAVALGGAVASGGGGAAGSAGQAGSSAAGSAGAAGLSSKPRIIVTTDGEVDDRSSFVRFLMYASDYDVAGIVQVNSNYQKVGHSKEKWVEEAIGYYERTLTNLRRHHPGYPDAASLLAVVKVGNETDGDREKNPPAFSTKDTPGSQLIIDTLLDDDPRPVHVPSWGGANTTAWALYKLQTAYTKAEFDKAVEKIRIYCIWYQDRGGQWIEDNIPGARIYEAYKWDDVWDYQSLSGPSPQDVKAFMTSDWLKANVKSGHGPLGAYTPQSYISEGDTPSFLPLIDNGLLQHLDYTWGGWGGRPVYDEGNHMTDGADDGNGNKPFWRWIPTLQNDFAARMDWAVAERFEDANHNPVARVAGDLRRTATPGEVILLDASPTTDPDGDTLSYSWWQYADADSAETKLSITGATDKEASFAVPNEPGKQLQVLLEVTDNGSPPLKHYQRILVDIR